MTVWNVIILIVCPITIINWFIQVMNKSIK